MDSPCSSCRMPEAAFSTVGSHKMKTSPPEKILSFVDWIRILPKKLDGYLVIEHIDPTLKDRVDVWGMLVTRSR